MTIQPKIDRSFPPIATNAAGAGLKPEHYDRILATRPALGFFEIHAENYMSAGGPSHRWLAAIGEIYPLSVHGVGLSLGSTEPLDRERLARLARVVSLYQPALVSEHLAWSDFSGRAFPDLLPMPYDEANLRRVAEKIDATQTKLARRILIENPATYLRFAGDSIAEPQFLEALCALSGCGLLLDVNNVHVSAVNHSFDAIKYLDAFPLELVEEIHLAGFAEARDAFGAFLIDNHGGAVSDEVWALYGQVVRRAGPRPTLIEWDSDVPEWEILFAETQKAAEVLAAALPSPLAGEGDAKRRMRGESCDTRYVEACSTMVVPSSASPAASQLLPQGRKETATGAEHWQGPFAAALQDPTLPTPDIFAACDLSARFAVYRNNSAVAAIGALKDQFPTVARLVGDDAFSGLARLFVRQSPPRSPVLGDYGAEFPAFLDEFLSQCEGRRETPYLADSARLDWASLTALRAPEATPCPVTRLAALDPARLTETKLVLHPSTALVVSDWPILAIGNAHLTPVSHWLGETVMVLRPEAELVRRPCRPGPAAFLRACAQGENLGQAARLASRHDENFDFGQTLVELTQMGAIVDFAL
jgi:hypothetical protein